MLDDETRAQVEARITDQVWRLNNLYWIKDKEGKRVLFQPNWAQWAMLEDMWYSNLILKARQLGITTFICIFFLDRCLFTKNAQAGIIAHNREDAEEFFNGKVKYAYDNLPEWIRQMRPATTDSARQLRFGNGSSIRIGTSMRSGTLQYLHVSEFGKVCAKYPDKAEEIVTGALNTVQAGQFVFIESTAEGQHGYFFDYCKEAQDSARLGKTLSPMDFKFFFFPWWKHPDYVLDPSEVVITRDDHDYFEQLRQQHGIQTSNAQRAWYVRKKQTQQESMLREYPSTPEEAFAASVKGAYYAQQMAKIREHGRLGRIPIESGVPVNTGWDLGIDDQTAIWFHQRIGTENRLVDYYERNGEGLAHFAHVLQQRGYLYGQHFLPHDVAVRELGTGQSRLERLEALGLTSITVVSGALRIEDGIEATRNFLSTTYLDEERCSRGIAALDAYCKEWDEKIGGFRERPLHNWASHGADALRALAVGFDPRSITKPIGRKWRERRRDGMVI